MQYSFFTSELEEIKNIIILNEKILETLEGLDKRLFTRSLHKNLTIEIYTFWENFVKNLIYSCYSNYKKILVDKRFIKKFLQQVNEKSYSRNLFLKNIEDNKFNITKDNLCHSNNLNYKELESLFKRVMFDSNEFKKHIEDFPGLREAIECLKNNAIIPTFDDVEIPKDTTGYVEAYLNLVVENRNSVAHQYQITEIYSINQFKYILKFIELLTLVVFEFCSSQLLKLGMSKKEKISNMLYPVQVIRGKSKCKNALLWIRNSCNKSIKKNDIIYFLDKTKNIYRIAKIITIKNKYRENCTEMLPLRDYSIEIDTVASINKRHKFFIACSLRPNSSSYEYSIVV